MTVIGGLKVGVYFLRCPIESESILLPRRSPLGIFDGEVCLPTDIWPLEVLCPECELGFSCPVGLIHPGEMLDHVIETRSLFRIPYTYIHNNSEVRREIYTALSTRDPKESVLEKAREYVRRNYGDEVLFPTPEQIRC
jgi:hypothetical protein